MERKLTPAEEAEINLIVEYTKDTWDTINSGKAWGGKREGSGRPSTGRKKRQIYVTDEEFEKIKELINELRGPR